MTKLLTKPPPQQPTRPQNLLTHIAAELNKRLDPELTQGRVVVFEQTLSVMLAPPGSSQPLIECGIRITGQGMFQELSVKCIDKMRGCVLTAKDWPLPALPLPEDTDFDEIIQLISTATLLAIKHHQQSILALTPITNPFKDKIR